MTKNTKNLSTEEVFDPAETLSNASNDPFASYLSNLRKAIAAADEAGEEMDKELSEHDRKIAEKVAQMQEETEDDE